VDGRVPVLCLLQLLRDALQVVVALLRRALQLGCELSPSRFGLLDLGSCLRQQGLGARRLLGLKAALVHGLLAVQPLHDVVRRLRVAQLVDELADELAAPLVLGQDFKQRQHDRLDRLDLEGLEAQTTQPQIDVIQSLLKMREWEGGGTKRDRERILTSLISCCCCVDDLVALCCC